MTLIIAASSQAAFVNSAFAAEDCVYKGKLAEQAQPVMPLRRGINLSGWWEDSPRNSFKSGDFQNIGKLGFDFVRLPFEPRRLEIGGERIRSKTLQKLRCDIVGILNNDLAVVFDLHPGEDEKKKMDGMTPRDLQAYLENFWKEIAPAFDKLPEKRIAFELLNEPDPELRSVWWDVQGKLVRAMRKIYPKNLLIVGSVQNGPWNYADAVPYPDENLLYDLHFYEPIFLTHHAADWLKTYDPSEKRDGIAYPVANAVVPVNAGSRMKAYIAGGWNRNVLEEKMASGLEWSKRTGARLVCLEFGVYRPYVPVKARASWLRDARETLESNGIPWAVWEYNESFGILERGGRVDEEIRAALGLNQGIPRVQ